MPIKPKKYQHLRPGKQVWPNSEYVSMREEDDLPFYITISKETFIKLQDEDLANHMYQVMDEQGFERYPKESRAESPRVSLVVSCIGWQKCLDFVNEFKRCDEDTFGLVT